MNHKGEKIVCCVARGAAIYNYIVFITGNVKVVQLKMNLLSFQHLSGMTDKMGQYQRRFHLSFKTKRL